MKHEYKFLHESDYRSLEYKLNGLGDQGRKLVNVAWGNDESLLIATLIR